MINYKTIRKYVGPLEIGIILLAIVAIGFYFERRQDRLEKEQELRELLAEMNMPADMEDPTKVIPDFTPKKEFLKNAENPHFKVLDSIYAPFAIDSLCRYNDSTRQSGFLTFSKKAPFYRDLCSTEKEYLMFVVLDKYFPNGEMLTITGIAENEELIQFHFKRTDKEEELGEIMHTMDSLLNSLKDIK